jgi:hypothetical protein
MNLVTKEVTVTVPLGAKATVDIPADLDTNVVIIGLQAFLGALVGISSAKDDRIKRGQLINFISGVASHAEVSVKKIIFANETSEEDMSHIVENLLKSLNKEPPKGNTKS